MRRWLADITATRGAGRGRWVLNRYAGAAGLGVAGAVFLGGVAGAGTAWRVQPVPKPPGSTLLQGVSCPVRGNCTAGGFSVTHGNPHALGEHWDGSSWAIQPVPQPA